MDVPDLFAGDDGVVSMAGADCVLSSSVCVFSIEIFLIMKRRFRTPWAKCCTRGTYCSRLCGRLREARRLSKTGIESWTRFLVSLYPFPSDFLTSFVFIALLRCAIVSVNKMTKVLFRLDVILVHFSGFHATGLSPSVADKNLEEFLNS